MKSPRNKKTKVTDLIRLLVSMEKNGQQSQRELALALAISPRAITRLLWRARHEYGVEVSCPAGNQVQYKILDWGLLNREQAYASLEATLSTSEEEKTTS